MMKLKKHYYFFAATKCISCIAGIFCGVDWFDLKQMLRQSGRSEGQDRMKSVSFQDVWQPGFT